MQNLLHSFRWYGVSVACNDVLYIIRLLYGWMDGVDGWMDGWMDGCTYIDGCQSMTV
jgi:hypothetical protein